MASVCWCILLQLLALCAWSLANPVELQPSLLLTMLVKNEAEHLRRTLPQWAPLIDYWVVGVDDANTDESAEIVKQYLGHLPGEIVIVHFDGMGTTWSRLVEVGLQKYPQATHGLLSDADFAPLQTSFDRSSLDVRCPQHAFTLWDEGQLHSRQMSWIYRNLPGAKVLRRMHQILQVPDMPVVAECSRKHVVPLQLEARSGGWSDRSGNRNERNIELLKLDLIDYPNDPRTLYFIGDAYLNMFDQHRDNPSEDDMKNLAMAVQYFVQRVQAGGSNLEEIWFTTLMLAEIHDTVYKDFQRALPSYEWCIQADPARADAYYGIGKYYRTHNEPEKAFPYLLEAASLPVPDRQMFNWAYLHNCLSKIELAYCAAQWSSASREQLQQSLAKLSQAQCAEGDTESNEEIQTLSQQLLDRINAMPSPNKSNRAGHDEL